MAKSKNKEVKVVDEVTFDEVIENIDKAIEESNIVHEVQEEVKEEPKVVSSGEVKVISLNQRAVSYSINGETKTKSINRVEHRSIINGNYSFLK